MSGKEREFSRRDFFKTAGVVGVGSLLGVAQAFAGDKDKPASRPDTQPDDDKKTPTVPTRKFGNTGEKVSILSLGGIFDIVNNQLILKQALKYGVTYWDTADCYNGGNSELGIGKYFEADSDARKKVFLVSKSCKRDPAGLDELLKRSLERMKTDYIDLYFIHGCGSADELKNNAEAWKKWSEQAKKDKKIRFFGFSTHSNMDSLLAEAAKHKWIDGIMLTYNYRLMHDKKMMDAVAACKKAGIGLTAMKTQGGGQVLTTNETELKLAGKFLKKGYTQEQAKLKAIWENKAIASICSQMPSVNTLMSNIAAALDKTTLAAGEKQLFQQYAAETCSGYCAGCTARCEPAAGVPIGDVMRYLMYHNSYGDRDYARQLFRELPAETRRRIASTDYTLAESRCPQKMAIGKLMRHATELLA